ncbi:MAG: AbrB/MazE/SpoVT family DNA-binding domain-containing protein [Candidatus Aenigmarchaeota archaeon]|nr:AbrB/MazE/SpoVT family DNA-binding domain-containing protein [Candidatus Aenigmarchaeota archaeon]
MKDITIKSPIRKIWRVKSQNSEILAISIPKDLVDKWGLKPGDYIFFGKNRNGEIIIFPIPKWSIEEVKPKHLINYESKNRATE